MKVDGNGARVLIVDDEQDFALTLAGRLELRNLRVSCFFDGAAGLAAILAEKPDLVLLDMRMPGLSGVDVLRSVRQGHCTGVRSDLPIIVLTGHCSKEDIAGLEALGVHGCYTKPVDFSELMTCIVRALRA